MATDTAPAVGPRTPVWLSAHLRRVAAASLAGLLAGFVVNGVGSRLAMMLLARLNPQVTGLVSDDGFRMGQFTLADTTGLVLFGTFVGVLGGLVFLALRGLRFGPPWFRTASMTVGPAVVVGSMLVHTDGVDFHVLEPTWLAIGLFVALPGLFAWTVAWLTDRWLEPDAWPARSRFGWLVGLVVLLPLGPFAALVIPGLAVRWGRESRGVVLRPGLVRGLRVAARTALTLLFVVSLWSLTIDATLLL